ncbi:serine/threonine-protein kinase [Intrasporangium sp.]|uniref:serine/threonine-protein kinase n=1 Tax=Intrasporangium sp. TaxID=1925024 RepID=UPI00322209DB
MRGWGTAGDLVGGRYVLVDALGHGGVGAVWRAWDITERIFVAVKLADLGEDLLLHQRWVAESASRIHGPHLLETLDWNSGQHGDYIVMPLVAGGSLGHFVSRHGPLPADQIARLIHQCAEALQVMHRRDLLHRDVKPSNILLEPGHTLEVRLADFGVLRTTSAAGLTGTGMGPSGTVGFIPPEAFRVGPDGCVPPPTAAATCTHWGSRPTSPRPGSLPRHAPQARSPPVGCGIRSQPTWNCRTASHPGSLRRYGT